MNDDRTSPQPLTTIPHVTRAATDPDARPVGGREADGTAFEGPAADRFRVEAAALTRLGPLEDELRDAGVPVTLIGKPLKVDPFALMRLTRFLKTKRFDVVQTWVFAANCYGRVAAARAKVPVVVTAEMAVDLWKGRGHLAIDRALPPP